MDPTETQEKTDGYEKQTRQNTPTVIDQEQRGHKSPSCGFGGPERQNTTLLHTISRPDFRAIFQQKSGRLILHRLEPDFPTKGPL